MRNFFKVIGITTFVLFSFIYTNKVSTVSKEENTLLNQIKKNYTKTNKVEAIITKDTIIPGINGKKVNINKSYKKIRELGMFKKEYLVYDKIYIKHPLNENYDKYIIGGNKTKKEVSLIFIICKNTNISKIIINEELNLFVDEYYLENNNVFNINKKYKIGNLGSGNYIDKNFYYMRKKILKYQKYNYCLYNSNLDLCLKTKSYIIKPILINKNPFLNTKTNLKNGSILAYEVNNNLNKEFINIINYIKNKGFKIVNLENLLKE